MIFCYFKSCNNLLKYYFLNKNQVLEVSNKTEKKINNYAELKFAAAYFFL